MPLKLHISLHGTLHFAAEADTFQLSSLDSLLTLRSLGEQNLLVIDADLEVPHRLVVRVIDIARSAGVVNLQLATGQ